MLRLNPERFKLLKLFTFVHVGTKPQLNKNLYEFKLLPP